MMVDYVPQRSVGDDEANGQYNNLRTRGCGQTVDLTIPEKAWEWTVGSGVTCGSQPAVTRGANCGQSRRESRPLETR
ncbi:MAG: hypothetical protein RIR10_1434 [Planctomycetota bacterium]